MGRSSSEEIKGQGVYMNLGRLNFWFGRVLAQGNKVLSPLSFLMLVYITIQEQPMFLLMIPVGVIGIIFWIWIDTRKVLEEELDYGYRRVPMLREMLNDIKEIKKCQTK